MEAEFNIKTMTKLEYPEEISYFIGWNNERTEIQANGVILVSQVMETELIEIDFYQDLKIYNSILIQNNIEID